MNNGTRHSVLGTPLVAGLLFLVVIGLARPGPTWAADTAPTDEAVPGKDVDQPSSQDVLKQAELEGIWRVLVVFLILSAIIESALAPVFQWRVFIKYCRDKGIRTLIAMLFAILIVRGYDLDIFRDVLVALGEPEKTGIGGQLLTAFLLTGGSSALFERLKGWGFRMNDEQRAKKVSGAANPPAPEPPTS